MVEKVGKYQNTLKFNHFFQNVLRSRNLWSGKERINY